MLPVPKYQDIQSVTLKAYKYSPCLLRCGNSKGKKLRLVFLQEIGYQTEKQNIEFGLSLKITHTDKETLNDAWPL